MNIYFSGIMGAGIGPLAVLAQKMGHRVFGSDEKESLMRRELESVGISASIGKQDGEYLRRVAEENGVDWFVHSAAVDENHAEMVLAQELGLKMSKRDGLINAMVREKGLKMVAVAGTHGKTTTTSMLIWTFLQLGKPISYLNGTTTSFAPPADYDEKSAYFIYEADEFDRNFLQFEPFLAVITSVSYDHPDIYPDEKSYLEAFRQFIEQSEAALGWKSDGLEGTSTSDTSGVLGGGLTEVNKGINLVGEHNRRNATLALEVVRRLLPEVGEKEIVEVLNRYVGAARRFEKISENVYSDYAHHPEEIRATIQMAREVAEEKGQKIAVVYEPHQNERQKIMAKDYPWAFEGADKIIWLPTTLSREKFSDNDATPLMPEFFAEELRKVGFGDAATAELDEKLLDEMQKLAASGEYLVLLLTAGPADGFVRGRV